MEPLKCESPWDATSMDLPKGLASESLHDEDVPKSPLSPARPDANLSSGVENLTKDVEKGRCSRRTE